MLYYATPAYLRAELLRREDRRGRGSGGQRQWCAVVVGDAVVVGGAVVVEAAAARLQAMVAHSVVR